MKTNLQNLESYSKFQAIKEKVEKRKLKEAEEISVEELAQLDPEALKFLKNNDLLPYVASIWDGVHGKTSNFKNKYGTEVIQLRVKDLKKLINDKEFRWLEVTAIGYGSGF